MKETSEKLLGTLSSKLEAQILKSEIDLGDAVITIGKKDLHDVFQILKLDSELSFNMLVDVTAVDWMDEREERFELVYHLFSLTCKHRLRVKIDVSEGDVSVATISDLWNGANFLEREVWDMYGITFEGHPNLTRILMYDEFKGHPLRKDYPVQGKQPRVKLLHPEVENTARKMSRPALSAESLVKIGKGAH